MPKKLEYKLVKEQIENKGYELLSKEYKNNRSKLLVKCDNDHVSKISYSNFKQGKRCFKCFLNNNKNETHPNWKGGVWKDNIPLYDTYAKQIEYAEKVRRNKEDRNVLEVKCTYCGKWFISNKTDVRSRIRALNENGMGDHRLYCSNECKQECPIFRKVKYSAEETNTKKYSREVQPELRHMVFERDNWECQKCENYKHLHCHHITGVEINPIESADIDNCITYCKDCHEEIHSQEGCKRSDYRRKKCK